MAPLTPDVDGATAAWEEARMGQRNVKAITGRADGLPHAALDFSELPHDRSRRGPNSISAADGDARTSGVAVDPWRVDRRHAEGPLLLGSASAPAGLDSWWGESRPFGLSDFTGTAINAAVLEGLHRFDLLYLVGHLAQMTRCEVLGRVIVRVLPESGTRTGDLGIVADAHTRHPAFIAGRAAAWAAADDVRDVIERAARRFWALTTAAAR
jgi:hypothetical protein